MHVEGGRPSGVADVYVSILYWRCELQIALRPSDFKGRVSILYWRCSSSLHHSSAFCLDVSFNSLLEMRGEQGGAPQGGPLQAFQFSIGDAGGVPKERLIAAGLLFQFSIGDADRPRGG